MQTASTSNRTFPSEVLRKQKPQVSAEEFGRIKNAFMMARIQQFCERRNMTVSEASDVMLKPQGYAEIDRVVDEHLHSSMCPDPTEYIFI